MTDSPQPATEPGTPEPTQPNPPAPPAPAPTPNHGGFSWDEFETRMGNRFAALGEQISSGIREAFPQAPAPAPSDTPPAEPSTGGDRGGDNPTDKDGTKKPEEPAHPTPGDHGGNRFATWWFGSKR